VDDDPIQGFGYRPLEPADLPLLHGWLHQPHVAEWWGDDVPETVEGVAAEYDPDAPANRHLHQMVIEVSTETDVLRPVGWIQWYLIADEPEWGPGLVPPPDTTAIDLCIGDPAFVGRGLGPRIIRLVVHGSIEAEVPGCREVWIDPNPRNERAVRAYAAVGFRDTGVDLVDPETAGEVRRLMIGRLLPGLGIVRPGEASPA